MMKFRVKNYFPKTFLLRSFFIIVIPVLWIFFASGTIFLQRHWKYVAKSLCENVARNVKFLCKLEEQKVLSWHTIQKMGRDFFHVKIEKVSQFNSQFLHQAQQDSQSLFLYEALMNLFPLGVRIDRTHSTISAWVKTSKNYYMFSTPTQRLGYRTLRLCGIWACIFSGLFLMIAVIMMRQQVRPLKRLSEWFRHITPDHIPELPQIEGAREIRRIGIGLRRMVQHLQQEFEQRHQFLLDLSHDLRTPLARIKLQCQFLPPSPDVIALQEDVDHMIRMIHQYLDFTTHTPYDDELIDFREILSMLQQKNSYPYAKKVYWDFGNANSYRVKGNSSDLQRCVQNLLDNALKYAQNFVSICVFSKENTMILCIQDDGLGISESIKMKIFKPFFKEDKSRTSHNTVSTGLGLSITERIIKRHKGSVYVTCETCQSPIPALQGAHIHMTLPLLCE
ncbi:sensor histidine kinase [Holospora curviuscula]|uniref:histidine kinase n=1 Tax=Holospora curviuscula TaxID=1082868 RepID=A0A2S5R8L9_9PROT|nr:HAMP domain-containing sensor histidine kinase [Holospora curviuscula]PPE03674.1 Osmolarity sensor protein EnvZ [Holospora curviuscula]